MSRVTAHLCLLLLVLFVAAPLSAGPTKKADSDAAVAQALEGKERAWLKAEMEHDVATFESIVADDWVAINPTGKTQTKAERAAEIKAPSMTTATIGPMKVRVFGDTAVVTGSDDEVSTETGKKVSEHFVWTDVFVKRNGKWVAVASQTALIK